MDPKAKPQASEQDEMEFTLTQEVELPFDEDDGDAADPMDDLEQLADFETFYP